MPHAHPSGFPPRSSDRPQHGEGQALALRGRGTVFRPKPSRYRSAGACPPRSFGLSRHGEGQALALRWGGVFYRSAGACPPRCPVDRSMARDRPSPYVKRRRFLSWRGGPRMPYAHPSGFPPRSFGRSQHGEGQALALREKGMCFD